MARELTKVHEEIKRGTLEELLDWATNQAEIRGEITVVVGPNDDAGLVQEPEAEALDSAIRAVLDAGLSPRDAAAAVAAVLGLKKRSVYNRLNKMLSDS